MTSKILLVDDNPIQASTRAAILENAGFSVAAAGDGPAALDLLFKPGDSCIGLVITDHLMPNMLGPELVAAIRGNGSQIPVLVLSGLPDAEAAYDGMNVAFRLKPFPPDSLISLAGEMLHPCIRRTA